MASLVSRVHMRLSSRTWTQYACPRVARTPHRALHTRQPLRAPDVARQVITSRRNEQNPSKPSEQESPQPHYNVVKLGLPGKEQSISAIALRDACNCSACVDPSSKQKNFSTTEIPGDISGEVVGTDGDQVSIKWTHDIEGFGPDHITRINMIYPLPRNRWLSPKRQRWNPDKLEQVAMDIGFDDYMESDIALYKALQQLSQYGLVFITGVPDSEELVAKIAERIGPVKNTLYGYTWDVRSVPDAANVAYTNKNLGFHMDLLPTTSPPALQLLHCIRSSAKGGYSLFTDAWSAAQDLWKTDPDAFLTLCDWPVNFHYDHPETHMYHRRMKVLAANFASRGTMRLEECRDADVNIHNIFWSPPFQAPFALSDVKIGSRARHNMNGMMARWHAAASKFDQLLHRQDRIHSRLMQPGECVIFANTRVVHARTAFEVDDAGKERWLRGCYLELDAWLSKYKVTRLKLERDGILPDEPDHEQ